MGVTLSQGGARFQKELAGRAVVEPIFSDTTLRQYVCANALRESPRTGLSPASPMTATSSTPSPVLATSVGNLSSTRPPGLWEDVEFDLELRHAAQVIARVEASIAAFEPAAGRGPGPIDDEYRGFARQQMRRAEPVSSWRGSEERGRAEEGREIVGQPFLRDTPRAEASHLQAPQPPAPALATELVRDEQKYATTAFVMGAVLLLVGLSFLALAVADARPDWWQPGLPLALLGQAALTVGVALRLDWFGRSRR